MNIESQKEKKTKLQLSCPMPNLDFDIITLGHGSGGLLTNRLLDSGVFDLLQNDLLNKRHDGVILNLAGPTAFTTDSFVISPIFFPGGSIGELAVNGTVNDLAMCGANPQFLSLSFIIEEGLSTKEFWDILVAIKFACEEAGVTIVTGDTKVVERGKGDKIFINTSGIGTVHPKAAIDINHVKVGDKIIVSDNLATHGVAIMSVREGLEFETTIESDTQALSPITTALLDKFGGDIHLFRDPTRGGVATVLTEIARATKLGIDIHQKDIPVDEQVNAVCEILGLDPLYIANEGIFIAIVKEAIANDILKVMKSFGACKNAAIIGEVVEEHARQVILTSSIGGKRVVNMLAGEQLPRIC
jgi:hydrogenase expression/formation protein HypE